jgi:hypothetical protein
MGFFSCSSDAYSPVQHPITDTDIRKMISHERIRSLDQHQVTAIEEALLVAKGGDGKLSVRQAYQVLHAMFQKHTLSKQNQDRVIAALQDYFEKKDV